MSRSMALNFFRLFSGISIGSIVAFFNLNLTGFQEVINFHLALLNGLVGLVIGAFTLVFLVYQIKKIKRDLRIKK